jgi:hypothetical protein
MRSLVIAAVAALAFSTGAVAGRHPAIEVGGVPVVRAEPKTCTHGQLCGRTCIPRSSICHKPKPPRAQVRPDNAGRIGRVHAGWNVKPN